jgi:hypothetical protein
MYYVMLLYEPQQNFLNRKREREDPYWGPWRAYYRELMESGVYVGGSPLDPPDTTATTIRVRGGERQVQDGPYADTKEQLGGFILLDLPTLDAALQWAARCPTSVYGAIEIRPAADMQRIFGPHYPFTLERGPKNAT